MTCACAVNELHASNMTISTTRGCFQHPTSLCELECRSVRRPLKRMGRVVLFAAPLLACAVPQSCWTSLRGSARRRGDHCNHCAHITCVSHNEKSCWVCGQLNVCMICGWLLACCLLQVVRRLRSIDSAPTGEAAFAARAAGA